MHYLSKILLCITLGLTAIATLANPVSSTQYTIDEQYQNIFGAWQKSRDLGPALGNLILITELTFSKNGGYKSNTYLKDLVMDYSTLQLSDLGLNESSSGRYYIYDNDIYIVSKYDNGSNVGINFNDFFKIISINKDTLILKREWGDTETYNKI